MSIETSLPTTTFVATNLYTQDSKNPLSKKFRDIDTPNDHNCLFWSAALAVLIPLLGESDEAKATFNQFYARLFGDSGSITLESKKSAPTVGYIDDAKPLSIDSENTRESIRAALKTYRFGKEEVLEFVGNPLYNLIAKIFRRRVVEQMETLYDEKLKETISKDGGCRDWETYCADMQRDGSSLGWGGEAEIQAISVLAGVNVMIHGIGIGYPKNYGCKDASLTINLVHVNAIDSNNPKASKNHYHYRIDEGLYNRHMQPKDESHTAITAKHIDPIHEKKPLPLIKKDDEWLDKNSQHAPKDKPKPDSVDSHIQIKSLQTKLAETHKKLLYHQQREQLDRFLRDIQSSIKTSAKIFLTKLSKEERLTLLAPKIFISYDQKDAETPRRQHLLKKFLQDVLSRDLRLVGLRPWLDIENRTGDIALQMSDNINDSQYALLIVTENYGEQNQKELQLILAEAKKSEDFLLPLLFEGEEDAILSKIGKNCKTYHGQKWFALDQGDWRDFRSYVNALTQSSPIGILPHVLGFGRKDDKLTAYREDCKKNYEAREKGLKSDLDDLDKEYASFVSDMTHFSAPTPTQPSGVSAVTATVTPGARRESEPKDKKEHKRDIKRSSPAADIIGRSRHTFLSRPYAPPDDSIKFDRDRSPRLIISRVNKNVLLPDQAQVCLARFKTEQQNSALLYLEAINAEGQLQCTQYRLTYRNGVLQCSVNDLIESENLECSFRTHQFTAYKINAYKYKAIRHQLVEQQDEALPPELISKGAFVDWDLWYRQLYVITPDNKSASDSKLTTR